MAAPQEGKNALDMFATMSCIGVLCDAERLQRWHRRRTLVC